MATIIQNLVEHALGDGARSAKYECLIALPDNTFFPDNNAITTLTKTSSFPGKTHEIVDLKFKGRSIPVKGQVKYTQTWECTFYLSEDHALKTAMEVWLEALDQQHNYADLSVEDNNNVQSMQKFLNAYNNYTYPLVIQQLNFELDYAPITYVMHNAFPTAISQVEVSAESVGTILEFTVTFAYSHYTSTTEVESLSSIEKITEDVVSIVTDAVDGVVDYVSDLILPITSYGTDYATDATAATAEGTDYVAKKATDIKQSLT